MPLTRFVWDDEVKESMRQMLPDFAHNCLPPAFAHLVGPRSPILKAFAAACLSSESSAVSTGAVIIQASCRA